MGREEVNTLREHDEILDHQNLRIVGNSFQEIVWLNI